MAEPWTIPENWQEHSLRLSAWRAAPQSSQVARQNLAGIRTLLQRYYQQGRDTSLLKILEMTGRYWLDDFQAADFDNMICTLGNQKYCALARLVYGQLLISFKCDGAHAMLAAGFLRIQPWLEPAEYFTLMKRHQQLLALRLGRKTPIALTLPELLDEAAVVRQLQGRQHARLSLGPGTDTLG